MVTPDAGRALVCHAVVADGVTVAAPPTRGLMFVPLPVGEPDPVRRLRLIAEASARRKKPAGARITEKAAPPVP